jgi:hypothetical protein
MSARAFVSRWWRPAEENECETEYDGTRKTRESPMADPFAPFAGSSGRAFKQKNADLLDSELAAVLLRGTIWGDVWLIADDDVLRENTDIARGNVPVLRFAEVDHLRRLGTEGMRALGIIKRAFPTARILQ